MTEKLEEEALRGRQICGLQISRNWSAFALPERTPSLSQKTIEKNVLSNSAMQDLTPLNPKHCATTIFPLCVPCLSNGFEEGTGVLCNDGKFFLLHRLLIHQLTTRTER